MAPRAISSGTISFGLVSVPIKLYSGTQSKSLHFNMLHAEDNARLKQQLVCTACGEIVERSATTRGYEYAKGQYVVLSAEELKALDAQSDQSIEIEEFVPIAVVDPVYFDKSYLLGPDKGGAKAYRLLADAMREAGVAAIARFASRGKQQLVLVREAATGLMMHSLFYADEVRDFEDLEVGEGVNVKDGELKLAVQLIGQLASDQFAPEKYRDEYRERALELIERKVSGQEIVSTPGQAPKGQIIDLMEALKASIADDGKKKGAARAGAATSGRKPPRKKGTTKKAARAVSSK